MSDPKVSVVIPMYNCERYILKCLNSLLVQSISEYEVIIVNDGSTDNSERLVVTFIDTCKAKNFRLISKTNGGISSARNVGIEEASGDWLTFVDADDWVERDFLKSMLASVENTNADFCISGYFKYFEDTGKKQACYSPENNCCTRDIAIEKIYYNAPISRMYSRTICMRNGVRFDERLHVGEDCAFNFDYLCYARTCVMINERQYIYRINLNSITHRNIDPERRKYSFESAKRFWTSFSNSAIIEKAFHTNRYLAESIFGALLWDVICSLLEKDKKNYLNIKKDPIAEYIIDNYEPKSSYKEKLFVFCLKHRLTLLLQVTVKLYYGKHLRTFWKKLFHTQY